MQIYYRLGLRVFIWMSCSFLIRPFFILCVNCFTQIAVCKAITFLYNTQPKRKLRCLAKPSAGSTEHFVWLVQLMEQTSHVPVGVWLLFLMGLFYQPSLATTYPPQSSVVPPPPPPLSLLGATCLCILLSMDWLPWLLLCQSCLNISILEWTQAKVPANPFLRHHTSGSPSSA